MKGSALVPNGWRLLLFAVLLATAGCGVQLPNVTAGEPNQGNPHAAPPAFGEPSYDNFPDSNR